MSWVLGGILLLVTHILTFMLGQRDGRARQISHMADLPEQKLVEWHRWNKAREELQ